jgi:UDP-3-O-[3-hydroxymyristoyl] glucosamine N-acyltransferase
MIHSTAVVTGAHIDASASVAEFAVVRPGARLGAGVVVHPHAFIGDDTEVGAETEIFHGAVVGKPAARSRALARSVEDAPACRIGERCSIGAHTVIYRGASVGDDSLVGDAASIREQVTVGRNCVIGRHVTVNYNVTIGDHTKIMDHSWLAGNMRIGAGVFISGGVLTANDNRIGADGYDAALVVGPSIEDGARIGLGALLLPSIVVGRNALVGAGSLVTRDVADGASVRGIPARIVGGAA